VGEPETLDPAKSAGVWEAHIQRDLFEGLVAEATDGTLIPGAAESWQISDDGRVYTFTLREDGKWSDGSPVTAQDFAFAFQRLLNPATASKYASILYPIRGAEDYNTGKTKDAAAVGVKALNRRTLEITLKSPTPYFLQQLAHHTAYPVSKTNVKQHGDPWIKAGNMLSNGAYRLAETMPQAHVKLVKNEHFHDADNVAIDTVYFYPTEDRAAAVKRFRAGELDLQYEVSDTQVPWLKENLPDELIIAPYLGIYYYTVNLTRKPFDDVRVRRALALAIRREILVEKITGAGEMAAYSIVPPGVSHYTSAYADFRDGATGKRMAEAQQLMQAAGFGPDNPLRFTLSYNTSENHKKIAVAIAAMWKQLGVRLQLENAEVKVHYKKLQEHDFDVARAGWIADYDDAQIFLFLLQSNNPELNYSSYSNPEFDRLMAAASVTADLDKRAALLQQAEAIAMSDMPYIPIYYYVSKNLVKTYVKGWKPNIKDVHPTRWMRIER
jgi:oligopeptide transport system substrate-binding protein